MMKTLKSLSNRKSEVLKAKVEPGEVETPSTIEPRDRLVEGHRRTAEAFLEGTMPAHLYFIEQAL